MGRGASILVTDAETRAVVAACRGLADAGFRVAAAAGSLPAPAHWSRACHERLLVPHPLERPEDFCDALEGAVRDGGYAALLPGGDASLLAISQSRDRLEPHVLLGLPSHPAVLRSMDKIDLLTAAEETGLEPPETATCADAEGAVEAARRFGFPVVLKPAQSVHQADGRTRRSGSVWVEDEATLRALAPDYGTPCLVQRGEAGTVVSYAGVLAAGALSGVAVSRYLRTWYPDAGNVCFSESIDPPEELSDRVSRLLRTIGWEGIFELELIERPDNSYAAIDLNPRVYGSLALAVAAGANLPALWCRGVLGERPAPARAKPGVRYRWEDADLRHMLRQLRRFKVGAALAVLRPRLGVAHAYSRLGDLGPLVARVLDLAGAALGRRTSAPPVTLESVRGRPSTGPRRPSEVAIVGAGPFGLAAAAHLTDSGVPVRVLGEPLEFWRERMPEGMILRSRKRSSHIADPQRELTIDRYEAATGRTVTTPSLTREEFIDYGLWFQRRAAPDAERRKVSTIAEEDGRFRLELEDGETWTPERVVVAAGLFPFPYRPEPFGSLSRQLVSHSSDHRDFGAFSGQHVLVVGAGQSALESAALLSESGARVEVVIRAPGINWLGGGDPPPARRSLRSRLPRPPTDVGGFATGWAAALPDAYRRMPGRLKPVITYRCIRPAGSGWLRPRLADVPIEMEGMAAKAEAVGRQVRVELGDGSERVVDHVLLGTGYAIDVRRYPFLSPDLADAIEVGGGGYPLLRSGLESSVPGLHFLGAPAAMTFGPIMRFVVGTWYAAPALARHVVGRRQPALSRSF